MLLCSSTQVLINLEMLFSFHNYTIGVVFYIIILWQICCHCICLQSQESCFGTIGNSKHTKEFS